jgi:hypothetical protein
MSITWSGRIRLLAVATATAALAVGCGEGNVLRSPTAPSSTLGSGTSLTDDAGNGTTASSAEFGALGKGGNGKGGGNNGPDEGETDSNSGPGNGNKPENPGNGGPGRSHEDRVVGFVSAKFANTITVNGVTVAPAADAVIRHGNRTLTIDDIAVGDHVHARGAMEGTTLLAVEIKVQDTGNDNEEGNPNATDVEGEISALSATAGCPVVDFMIGTTKVVTSAATTFDDVLCSALANGNRLSVEGTEQADGTVQASRLELESGADEVQGFVFELTGTASCGTATPALTFKVGATALTATTVKTTTPTTFAGVTCATLANGARVEVEGTAQADGSITAASVELH